MSPHHTDWKMTFFFFFCFRIWVFCVFVKSAVQKTAHAEKKAYLLRQLHNEKIAGEQRLTASLHVTVQTEIEE